MVWVAHKNIQTFWLLLGSQICGRCGGRNTIATLRFYTSTALSTLSVLTLCTEHKQEPAACIYWGLAIPKDFPITAQPVVATEK